MGENGYCEAIVLEKKGENPNSYQKIFFVAVLFSLQNSVVFLWAIFTMIKRKKYLQLPAIGYGYLFVFVFIVNTCVILPNRLWADIPASYVDIGYGARPVAMGGAFVATPNDVHALHWNPAGLATLTHNQMTAMYTKQFGLIPYYFAAFGSRVNKRLGVGVAALSSGNEVLRESTLQIAGAFSVQRWFCFGMTVKLRNSVFGQNQDGGENRSQGDAYGYGLDLGILWRVSKAWYLGAFGRDVFAEVMYNNTTREVQYSEAIPPGLVVGTTYRVTRSLLFAVAYEKSLARDTYDKLNAGFEGRIFKLIALRGGISQELSTDAPRKYALGLGIIGSTSRFSVNFDFAYQFYHLANTPRVSTTIHF